MFQGENLEFYQSSELWCAGLWWLLEIYDSGKGFKLNIFWMGLHISLFLSIQWGSDDLDYRLWWGLLLACMFRSVGVDKLLEA